MKKHLTLTTLTLILGFFALIPCNCQDTVKKSNTKHCEPETDTFIDPRDGKTYKTVKVGEQWVMAENFAYKPDSGSCWAYDNADSNIAIYGYLYDWETAMNIAPKGWHLPSYEEWYTIEKTLGAKKQTIIYMEKIYPLFLVGGSSGLDMLLGGIRTCDGEFKGQGDQARFWNSFNKKRKRNSFGLYNNKAGHEHGIKKSTAPWVFNSSYEQSCIGYSVRLFKD